MAETSHDPLVGVGHGGETWENLALHHKKVISAETHERLLEQPGELAALEGKVYPYVSCDSNVFPGIMRLNFSGVTDVFFVFNI